MFYSRNVSKMFYCYALLISLIPLSLASGSLNVRSLDFVNHHREYPMGCTCEDKSLCGPIPPADGSTRLAYTKDPTNWEYYNFTKLTEMALFFDVSRLEPEMVCLAHKNNVQLHLAGFFGYETFLDPYKQEKWIQDHLKMVTDNNLDGINVDYEQERKAEWETHLVDFILELTVRLKEINSNYQLTYCEPSSPRAHYDMSTIPKYVDYLMIMSYDEVWDRQQGYSYPTANQQPSSAISGIARFIQAGVPPSKLVIGMPWYGYIFDCENITSDGECVLSGTGHSDMKQSTFPRIYQEYFANGGYDFANGWDEASLTPFLTISSEDNSVMKQFWCDNGTSLISKSEMYKQFKIRGVAAFHVDCVDYTTPELRCMSKPFWEMFSLFED